MAVTSICVREAKTPGDGSVRLHQDLAGPLVRVAGMSSQPALRLHSPHTQQGAGPAGEGEEDAEGLGSCLTRTPAGKQAVGRCEAAPPKCHLFKYGGDSHVSQTDRQPTALKTEGSCSSHQREEPFGNQGMCEHRSVCAPDAHTQVCQRHVSHVGDTCTRSRECDPYERSSLVTHIGKREGGKG